MKKKTKKIKTLLNKDLVSKEITYVTIAEHEKWHKKNGSCGSGKEHEACMKEQGIRIKKS